MQSRELNMDKDAKVLSMLKKKLAKPEFAGYLVIIVILGMLIHSTDEIASTIANNLRSPVLIDFFITSQGLTYTEDLFNKAVSNSAIIGMVTLPLMILAPFYRALPDKYGRKPFLVINTLGMGVGMAICALSTSFLMYVVGGAISGFFVLHDTQVVYLMEVAPADKRARFYGIAKSVGALSTVLIPAMRSVFMGADSSKWRLVYYVPVIIGCVIALVALFVARETKPFLTQRITDLEMSPEERKRKVEEEKAKKKSDPNKMGVFPALKYIWNNKDSRTLLFIVTMYYFVSTAFAGYFEPIMVTSGMSTENVTKALYFYSFMFAGCTFIAGFLADSRLGRKGTVGLFGSLSIVMFCLFVAAAKFGWSPYLVGIFYGLYLGTYWMGGNFLTMMMAEKVPTERRSSLMGGLMLVVLSATMIGSIYMIIVIRFISISTGILIIAVPSIVTAMILLITKVKETKGVDLTTIGQIVE